MDPTNSLNALAQQTAQTPSFKAVVERLHSGERDVLLGGLPHSLAAFLLAHLQRTLDRTILVVAADEDRAEQWRDDLQAIAGGQVVRHFYRFSLAQSAGANKFCQIGTVRTPRHIMPRGN